jgi:hypothetical protein
MPGHLVAHRAKPNDTSVFYIAHQAFLFLLRNFFVAAWSMRQSRPFCVTATP